MNLENFEDLKEQLFRKGFDKHLNEGLEQQLQSGAPEFIIEHRTKVNEDEVGYLLHFRRDAERDKVYLNSFDAAILHNTDAPGQLREHTFPAEKLITAMEAYRMLKYGELVAVNKTLFNKDRQQYNTWIGLDINGKKDERNNYPVNTYHENYFPKKLDKLFILKDELAKLPVPVKELESARNIETIEKSLKKANLVQVTILHNGEETTGTLAVNPKEGVINVYDANMQLIENQQQSKQQTEKQDHLEQKNATPEQEQGEVKKKPWENRQDQQVKWKPKAQHQNKGISR